MRAGRRVCGRVCVDGSLRRLYSSSRRSRYGRASQLRCTLPFTPPVPAEAERSRARVPTLAPGGACLMTSLTRKGWGEGGTNSPDNSLGADEDFLLAEIGRAHD